MSLYRDIFLSPGASRIVKSSLDPLSSSTYLYVEFEIAKSLGMSHSAYKKLPRKERRTWFLWQVLANEKERYQMDQAKSGSEMGKMNKPHDVPKWRK